MDRFEKIRAKRQELDEQKQNECDERARKVKYYEDAIKALAPRLKELHSLAKECIKNYIPLGKMTDLHGNKHYPEFVSEWWYHRPGFIVSQYPQPNEDVLFGIVGGGAAGRSLVIDKDGIITKSPLSEMCGYRSYESAHRDFCYKCQSFLESFDELEKGFLTYIDSL
jgi:hypothetical protein